MNQLVNMLCFSSKQIKVHILLFSEYKKKLCFFSYCCFFILVFCSVLHESVHIELSDGLSRCFIIFLLLSDLNLFLQESLTLSLELTSCLRFRGPPLHGALCPDWMKCAGIPGNVFSHLLHEHEERRVYTPCVELLKTYINMKISEQF